MVEQVRWVTKAEAVREMEISLSTLDRKIRRREVEVRRERRRVYVQMEGPAYLSDGELLRPAPCSGGQALADRVGAGWTSVGVGTREGRA